jgi:TRAP-type transport system periplasmic protein
MSRPQLRRIGLLIILALAVVACGGDDPAAQPDPGDVAAPDAADTEGCEPTTARLSHHLGEANSGHRSFEAMAEELAETTDGRVTLEIFSGAQLGGLGELVELLQAGVIQMGWLATGPLSGFLPEISGLELPFIYQERHEFNDLIDGPVGERVNQLVRDELGIELLFWSEVGMLMPFFRGVTDVTTPDDFRGLTMRVAQTPIFLATMRALGAEAVDMPLGDTYTAMQTGAVAGSILPYWAFRDTSLYEVSDSMTEVGIILANLTLGTDKQWLDSLCEHDRQAVMNAARTAEQINRDGWPAEDAENREYLISQGVEMVQVDDIEPFRQATQSVIDEWAADHGGELWEMIQQELGL